MFLFEEFTYSQEWAEKYYGDSLKHNNWYLEGIITDWDYLKTVPKEDIDRFHFAVNRYKLPDSNINNLYQITIFQHIYNQPDPPFKQDQIDYLKDKLSILGDAIKIIIPHYNGSMIIQYFIEKDEYRWNMIQAKVNAKNAAVDAINIQEPTIDAWVWMCDAFYGNKNPRIIFKKFKLDKLIEFMVIAYKLNWANGIRNIRYCMYHFLKPDTINNNNELDNTCDAIKKYADNYQPDEEIQELLNSFKSGVKNEQNVPTKVKPITNILDTNEKVEKYYVGTNDKWNKYAVMYLIKVETTNGKVGWINLSRYNDHMYELMAYSTDDMHKICREPKTCRLINELQITNTVKDLAQMYTENCINAIYNM